MNEKVRKEFLNRYESIHRQLWLYCRAMSGNSVDADDLLQDTILNAMESFGKLKDQSKFKSYVFSIATNLYRMKKRRQKFNAEFEEDELKQIVKAYPNQEYATDLKIIHEKIMQLPDKTAQAMMLYFVSDLPLKEIQEIQGGSLSGVKLRLKRGKEKLLQSLNSEKQKKLAMILLSF